MLIEYALTDVHLSLPTASHKMEGSKSATKKFGSSDHLSAWTAMAGPPKILNTTPKEAGRRGMYLPNMLLVCDWCRVRVRDDASVMTTINRQPKPRP